MTQSTTDPPDDQRAIPNNPSLVNKRIGFLGKLGAMTRKEACQWLKQYNATVAEKLTGDLDLVIIGADELPEDDIQAMLNKRLRERIHSGEIGRAHV